MLFNSLVFLFLFLPVTYTVFWSLSRKESRHLWLAVTGYVFYGYWDPRFCLLMLFSTAVSYLAGLGLLGERSPGARKLFLVVPITVDLLLLGFFKYANFAVDTLQKTLHLFGFDLGLRGWDIILPIGISFYTFHTISYIVDSYRRVITPTRNFIEFAAYVSLFSQLVAGPIVRFRQMEGDLENLDSARRTRWLLPGLAFFAIGMIEKVVVADALAAFVDPWLANYDGLSTAGSWLAMLGYSFQLYFDFCGYSTMAVGLGLMFGLRIPRNFDSPYKALDPSDFWRRWHISLSTCLRDYLYIPLGGSKKGEWFTYRNLMLTMLIGGLWHGANWTFVVWGGYHGLLLMAHKRFSGAWDGLPAALRHGGMFLLAVVGWVFFRATDFGMAARLLKAMFVPTPGSMGEGAGLFASIVGIAALWAMKGPNAFDLVGDFRWEPRYAFAVSAAMGVAIAIIAGGRNSPFLYFQF